jgi:ATP-binding cassette subfamily B protein
MNTINNIVQLMNHHGVMVSVQALVHNYQINHNELAADLISRIFNDYKFSNQRVNFSWRKLKNMGLAYPALALLNDGTTLIFSGFDVDEETGNEFLIAYAPDSADDKEPYKYYSQQEIKKFWSGELILIKQAKPNHESSQEFNLRWFIPEIWRQKRIFFEIAGIALFIHLLALAVPLYFQIIVDKVLVNNTLNTLHVLTIGVISIIIFEGILGFLRDYLLTFATSKIDMRLATRTFSKLVSLPLPFFERNFAGVITKHMQQIEQIREFLTGNMLETFLDASVLFVFLPILFWYSKSLAWIVVIFSVAIALVIAVIISPFYRRLMALYAAEGERQATLVETIHGMATIKSLALESSRKKSWDKSAAYTVSTNFAVEKMSNVARSITKVLKETMSVTIIWFGAQDVFTGSITVGGLVAFQMLAGNVSTPLIKLVELAHEYQKVHLSIKMLGEIMNRTSEGSGYVTTLRPELKGKIEFDEIIFRYNSNDAPALNNISLQIAEGEVVGLVGHSGSGKSTITRLIQGLYSSQSGILRLDGIDIREIDLIHLRQSIGVVLQDNFLFHGTVRENISITKANATPEEIDIAAKMAGAYEFIQYLPQGYETVLEENGSNLSGGQKQRLAIARALLKKPNILIFDEATSALDPESEYIIQQNLEKIAKGRTMILVAHRLSTLRNANRIIVLEKGEIQSIGTHDELLKNCPIYKHLWDLQSRYSQ